MTNYKPTKAELQEWYKELQKEYAATRQAQIEAERQLLDKQDVIDDLLCGIRIWKEAKLAEVDDARWDNVDEIIVRWIEAAGLA